MIRKEVYAYKIKLKKPLRHSMNFTKFGINIKKLPKYVLMHNKYVLYFEQNNYDDIDDFLEDFNYKLYSINRNKENKTCKMIVNAIINDIDLHREFNFKKNIKTFYKELSLYNHYHNTNLKGFYYPLCGIYREFPFYNCYSYKVKCGNGTRTDTEINKVMIKL